MTSQFEFHRTFPRDKESQWVHITTDCFTNQSLRRYLGLWSDHKGNSKKPFAIALVIAWLHVCLRYCKDCSKLHISKKLLLFSKPCVGCFLKCLFCVMHNPNLDYCVLNPLSYIWYLVVYIAVLFLAVSPRQLNKWPWPLLGPLGAH